MYFYSRVRLLKRAKIIPAQLKSTLQKMCWKWVCCDRLFLFPCIWISTFQTPAQNLQLFTNIKQYLFFMHRLSVSANIFWCHSDCQNQMDVITWSSKFLRDLLLIILVNQPSIASQKKIRHRKSKIFSVSKVAVSAVKNYVGGKWFLSSSCQDLKRIFPTISDFALHIICSVEFTAKATNIFIETLINNIYKEVSSILISKNNVSFQ